MQARRLLLAPLCGSRSLAFVYAACLTLAGVTGIYVNMRTPFWHDETLVGAFSCQPTTADTIRLAGHDVHPIAYFLLARGLFALAGCHLWLVRAVSLIASLCGAALLLSRVARLGGDLFIAAALLFASPVFWDQAFEGRPYALLFLAGCGVVACALSDHRRVRLAAIGFALAGGLLNYFASFLFVVLFLIAIVTRQHGRVFWGLYLAAGVTLLPYYALQLRGVMSTGATLPWLSPPKLQVLLVGLPEYLVGNPVSLLLLVVVIAMLFLVQARDPPMSRLAWVVFISLPAFAVMLFAASYVRPMFQFRYLYFLFPCLVLPLALWSGDTPVGAREAWPARADARAQAIALGLIAVMVFNTVHMIGIRATMRTFEWKAAIQSMRCSPSHPCAFVMDTPGRASFSQAQSQAVADFWAVSPNHFDAIAADEAVGWLARHPGGQLLWTSYRPFSIDVEALARRAGLSCRYYTAAAACTIQPAAAGG